MKKKHWQILALLLVLPTLAHCQTLKQADSIKVKCEDKRSVAAGLQALQEVKRGTTVHFSGTCHLTKSIVITGNGITLSGGELVGVPDKPVISIVGAKGVTVRNLRVTRGAVGIEITRGAIVRLRNVTAQKNGTGIRVESAPLTSRGKKQASTHQNNGAIRKYIPSRLVAGSKKPAGNYPILLAAKGSPTFFRAAMDAGTVGPVTTSADICIGNYSKNSSDGVLSIGATVWIACNNNHFDENGDSGLEATQNSNVQIHLATVLADKNKQSGIDVNDSTMTVTQSTIQANGNVRGFVVENGGSAKIKQSTVVRAAENTESGFHFAGSLLALELSQSEIESASNPIGVKVDNHSEAYLVENAHWDSTNNDNKDVVIVDPKDSLIECYDGSTLARDSADGEEALFCPQ